MTSERKQVYTRRISGANRAQLITIVYDMALEYMEDAKEALSQKDEAAFEEALTRARACVDDLLNALDMQYELSVGLQQLYLFSRKELTMAQVRRDDACIGNARRVLDRLRDAWTQIEDYDDSGTAFDNAQTVYAGLTYGKGTLNESVSDPAENRGLTV